MLAPIVTKEMKLFPSQNLPPRVKNVRHRAHSLQDFVNGNAIHVTTTASAATAQSTPTAIGIVSYNKNIKGGRERTRNSQSIGSLPTNTVLATGFPNVPTVVTSVPVPVRSSPKYSTSSASLRKPLDSIVEGIETQQKQGCSADDPKGKEKKLKFNKPAAELSEEKNVLGRSKQCFSHRSSHDDGLASAINRNVERRAHCQRTQSMEGGRKKRADGHGQSTGVSGCFAMWLSSKFRKGGSRDSGSSDGDSAPPEQQREHKNKN